MVEGTKTHYAVCMMHEDKGSGVNGIVKFVQEEGKEVKITAEISGLTPGEHGFHIHEFGILLLYLKFASQVTLSMAV